MTKNDAVAFINALNAIRRELRPTDFEMVANTAVVQLIVAVANDQVVVESKPVEAPKGQLKSV